MFCPHHLDCRRKHREAGIDVLSDRKISLNKIVEKVFLIIRVVYKHSCKIQIKILLVNKENVKKYTGRKS